MTLSAQASMGSIERFIQEVGAAEKRAEEALSEPGSKGGETSHPVKNVDDRLQTAPEGERSKENTKDVKADQGKPSVENAPESVAKSATDLLGRFARPVRRAKQAADDKNREAVTSPGSAADDHLQIGTKVEATGEDPGVETSSAKSGKEDPGSKHPARTDNDQLDGHKYSADQLAELPLEKLAEMIGDLGSQFCAEIASEEPAQGQAKQAADDLSDAELAHQAGWELAGLMTGDFDKSAADALVHEKLQAIIKQAADDADLVGPFVLQYQDMLQKAAEGEMMDPSQMPPPGGGMPMGGGGGEDPAAAMMGGEGGGGGGEDMMAAMGGGEPGGEPPAEGGEGGGGDVDVAELLQILEQLGITPEELEAALAQQGEGGGAEGGEGGEEEGGMPAEGPGKMAGDRHVKRGSTKEGVREYIQEVISRSRRK